MFGLGAGLASAEEAVLERYREAIGAEALADIETVRKTGTYVYNRPEQYVRLGEVVASLVA